MAIKTELGLVQSARNMYQAMYTPVSNAWVGQVAVGLGNTVATIAQGVKAKRKENMEQFSEARKSLLDEFKDNKITRVELNNKLTELKDTYAEANRLSTKVFTRKEDRMKADEVMNDVMSALERYEEDLASLDGYLQSPQNVSNANKLGDQVDNVFLNDPRNVDQIQFGDDGLYVVNHKGENVRLSQYKPPIAIWQNGIDASTQAISKITNGALRQRGWDGDVADDYLFDLQKVTNQKEFVSLLFDDIGDFNWADEELKERNEALRAAGDDPINLDDPDAKARALEVLKVEYDENPDKFKKLWVEDMMEVGEERYNNTLSAEQSRMQKASGGSGGDFKTKRVFNTNYNSYPFTEPGIKAEYGRGANLKVGETLPWIFHPKVKGAEGATVTVKSSSKDTVLTMPDGSKVTKKGTGKKTYVLTRPSLEDATRPIVVEYDTWEELWNAESGFENPGQYAGTKLPE